MDIPEFLPEVLKSEADVPWLMRRLRSNAMNTGNIFTSTDAIILLSNWMAEYSAYVRTVYWPARPENDEGAVLTGFRDTSALWESKLTLERARADAQYGEVVRNGMLGGSAGYGGHPWDRSPKDRPLLGKRVASLQERVAFSLGSGSG